MPDYHGRPRENPRSIRPIAERAVSRAGGAPLVAGNACGLLSMPRKTTAPGGRPSSGEAAIFFENYIITRMPRPQLP